MTFDKLVYREAVPAEHPASDGTGQGSVLTVDFGGIGELTVRFDFRGEVNWRRITRPVLDVLRAKLDACKFEMWGGDCPASDTPGGGLELFLGEKSVKQVSCHGATPDQWALFQSVLELCGALAENRSRRDAVPPPGECAAAFPHDAALDCTGYVPNSKNSLTNRKHALY